MIMDIIDHNPEEMLRLFRQCMYDRLREEIEKQINAFSHEFHMPQTTIDETIRELIMVIQAAQVDWMYQYSLALKTGIDDMNNEIFSLALGAVGRIFMNDYIKNNPMEGGSNE